MQSWIFGIIDDPSEILPIFWFAAQDTILIIDVENYGSSKQPCIIIIFLSVFSLSRLNFLVIST